MSGKPRYTVRQVSEALKKAGGIYTETARILGCRSPNTVANYVRRYKLQRVEQEIVESKLDLAESKLDQLINEGHFPAIRFYLLTKGRGRGYTTRTELVPIIPTTRGATGPAIYLPALEEGPAPTIIDMPQNGVEPDAAE